MVQGSGQAAGAPACLPGARLSERRKSCALRLHLQGQYPGRNRFLLLRFRCGPASHLPRLPPLGRRLLCFRPQLSALRQGDERRPQRNLSPSRHQHVHRPESRHHIVPGRKKVNHKGPVVQRVSFLSRLDLIHHQPDRAALGKNLRTPPINAARELALQSGSRRSFVELRAALQGNPNHRGLTVSALRIRAGNRRPGDKCNAHNLQHESSSQGTMSSMGGLPSCDDITSRCAAGRLVHYAFEMAEKEQSFSLGGSAE